MNKETERMVQEILAHRICKNCKYYFKESSSPCWLPINDVVELYIPKQRVRDAIEKVHKLCLAPSYESCEKCKLQTRLLEELGLEEKE